MNFVFSGGALLFHAMLSLPKYFSYRLVVVIAQGLAVVA